MTPAKAADQSAALWRLAQAVQALQDDALRNDGRLHFAWAHQAARNLIGALRFLDRQRDMPPAQRQVLAQQFLDRKSTRLNSSHSQISYAVFCLKKKNTRLSS